MTSSTGPHAAAVLIGRFQPFHNGHALLLRQALEAAPVCVLVLGSSHQARTPKNPFTWQERAEMIRLSVAAAERSRLLFVPMRDYYDEARWTVAVRREVTQALARQGVTGSAAIALVGHFKDATSEYLRGFPGWSLLSVDPLPGVDATSLRNAVFGGAAHLDPALGALVNLAPASTLEFMRAWAVQPHFPELVEEWRMLKRYKAEWASAPYPPVFVTVDAVVCCAGHVLLIQRGRAPGKGLHAVPGGFIEERETVYQSAVRELKEETNLSLLDLTMRQCFKGAAVFDHPDRSLRGRTITHAHHFELGERELPEVQAGDDAQTVQWTPVDQLCAMEDRFHDDHFHMLDHFLGLTAADA